MLPKGGEIASKRLADRRFYSGGRSPIFFMPPSASPTIEPYVLRPGENRDLPSLKRLLTTVIGGLTTLPNEDSFLEAKLQQSEASFAQKVKTPGA